VAKPPISWTSSDVYVLSILQGRFNLPRGCQIARADYCESLPPCRTESVTVAPEPASSDTCSENNSQQSLSLTLADPAERVRPARISKHSVCQPRRTGPTQCEIDIGDLLLAVNGEASHGTAPLGWHICWFTTCRHDGPMAGPHRRYSSPRQGDSEVSRTETPQRFERGLEHSGPRSPDIVHLPWAVVAASVYVRLRIDDT